MIAVLVGGPDPQATSWQRDLPIWAVLVLDRTTPGWRARYHHLGRGLSSPGFLVVFLDDQVGVVVAKGD